jgi:hypothetical protein
VPFARNSTRATVALPATDAVAFTVSVVLVPSATVEPEVGDVTVADRLPGAAATFAFTTDEVTTVPAESVTFAVSATVPDAAGVQLTE